MTCPHCGHQSEEHREFCASCSKILPVMEGRSHYEVLGYSSSHLQVNLGDLENRFFELSKKFHPDRFATKSVPEIELSHEHSSAVNNAYRTLKSPFSRAKYLVEKELGSIEEKSAAVPPELADLFFEVHESLDEISDSAGDPPQSAITAVKEAVEELKQQLSGYESDLKREFEVYDRNPDRKVLEKIKEILSHRSYIQSFLRQVEAVFASKMLKIGEV